MVLALLAILPLICATEALAKEDNAARLQVVDATLSRGSYSAIDEPPPLESLFAGLKYCDIHNITCPHCNNAFTYAAGAEYEIECDVARTCPADTGSGKIKVAGLRSSMNVSMSACVEVCEAERPHCQGGSYSQGGCELCLGDTILYETKSGYTGFIPATLSIAAPPLVTAPLPPAPNTTFVPYPPPNATAPLAPTGSEMQSKSLTHTAAGSGITFTPNPLVKTTAVQSSGSLVAPSISPIAVAPGSGGAHCDSDNLQCPLCKGATVTDSGNVTYTVRCDSYLFSKRSHTYPGSLNSSQCLSLCDRNATCVGGFLDPGRRCTLAYGPGDNYSFLAQPNYISFFAVNKELQNLTTTPSIDTTFGASIKTTIASVNFTSQLSYYLPITATGNPTATVQPIAPINLTQIGETSSRNPKATVTRNFTVTVQSTPGSYSHASFTYLPPATPSLVLEDFCDPANIVCPVCDGLVIQDAFNKSYRVQCDYKPTCEQLVGYYGKSSIEVCLHHCDVAVSCVAAIFSNGHCDLCEGFMEGAYGQQRGYTVFVSDKTAASLTMPASTSLLPSSMASSMSFMLPLTTATDHFVTTTSRITPKLLSPSPPHSSSSSSAKPTQWFSPIPAVACPNSDNELVADHSDNRRYQVQCDTLYGASRRRHVVVDDFQSCAASCQDECNGFLFGFGRNCILITGVSAVASVTGWTAGVQVVQSTSAHSPSMVTPTSV